MSVSFFASRILKRNLFAGSRLRIPQFVWNWRSISTPQKLHIRSLLNVASPIGLLFSTAITVAVAEEDHQQLFINLSVVSDELVTDDNYDICMVTETWLKEDNSAKRIECSLPGFDFLDVPRIDRNGGGTVLLAKSQLKTRLIHSGCKSSFEFSEWKLKCQSDFKTLIIVYRLPYSAHHPVTARTFIDEFSSYLESIIITPNKLLIGGDFNIHVNDESDVTAKAFLDLLQNYDLINHVWQPTHVAGNTLDLIITRNNNEISLDSPFMGSFISDHCFVKVVSSIEKPEVQAKEINYRKSKDINLENFKRDIAASSLAKSNFSNLSLTELAELYDTTLSAILEERAPILKTFLKISQYPRGTKVNLGVLSAKNAILK
eukprot:gene12582-3282_t